MKNKKGFTLAELLGVIVILLLLVLIVTPIFINYSKKASKSAYEVQINTIKESAREWALDEENIKLLPTKENECVEITLEKLKEIGLLDYNITNPKTKAKFSDESTVIIRKVGTELTYTYNENGEETCDTVITTDYPRWVFVSSTPAVASDTDEVTVNIKSDRKISEESLDPEDITVKVGGKIIDDAVVTVSCSGVNPLTCELKINNLDGDGRLSLVIDKDTMKDEDLNPSRITNIQTNTTIDTSGPKITYTGKTNTNSSIYYATKDDTVVIKFKAEDNGEVVNELAAEDIIVYLDGVPVDCGKSLTTSGSGTKVDYELTLTNVTGNGKLSIKIPTGKIKDNRGNLNNEKIISPGITYDNQLPIITYTPNGTVGYVRDINVKVYAIDEETGVNENTLKYIFTTDINENPNVAIANGGKVSKSGVTGDYYIIGYVCDYAGNCATVPSNIYQMNNSAPEIEITPDHNSGYEREASIKIKVTSHGEAIDEGSLKYIISENTNDTPNKSFTNNENITITGLSGVYYVIAEACDVTGLCTKKESQKFYFDNEAPDVIYNPNGTYNSGSYYWTQSVDVSINVTDNVSVESASYILSDSKTATPNVTINNGSANKTVTLTNETKTLYLIARGCDSLGNCKTSVSNKYQIDKTKPVVDSKSQSQDITTINISDDISLARYDILRSDNTLSAGGAVTGTSYSVVYQETEYGTYTIKVTDHVGNIFEENFVVPGYTVSFNANGGSGGQSSNVTVGYGAKMPTISTTAPTKTGYTFQGWYDNANYTAGTKYYNSGGSWARRYDKTSNTTLYAGWKANTYTVTLDKNGGTGGTDSVTATYDAAMPSATMPTRTGYTFEGYYDAKTGGTKYYNADGTSAKKWNKTSNTTLYARWTAKTYTVTLNKNGGLGGTDSVTATYDAAMPSATMPTRSTYTFEGYYDTSEATGGTKYYNSDGSSARKWDKTSNTTLYARWAAQCNFKEEEYNYDANNKIRSWTVPAGCSGTYTLEVWGAQGGSVNENNTPGAYGGYAKGEKYLSAGTTIYIVIGEQGKNATNRYNLDDQRYFAGGYNGGGRGHSNSINDDINDGHDGYLTGGGSGGGATHIATTNRGELKNYASHTDDLLIVAGGGGGSVNTIGAGGGCYCTSGTGGGATGGNGTMSTFGGTTAYEENIGTGGGDSASTGHSFGEGADYAGGGYYGGSAGSGSSWWEGNAVGYGAGRCYGAGGGSGYIGGVKNGTMENGKNSGNGKAKITLKTLD